MKTQKTLEQHIEDVEVFDAIMSITHDKDFNAMRREFLKQLQEQED